MSERPRASRFKQIDVARAIRAAQKAKLPIGVVRITRDGDILVIPGQPEPVPSSPPTVNEWDG